MRTDQIIEHAKKEGCSAALIPELNPDGVAMLAHRLDVPVVEIVETDDYDLAALQGGPWPTSTDDLRPEVLEKASALIVKAATGWVMKNSMTGKILTVVYPPGDHGWGMTYVFDAAGAEEIREEVDGLI